MPIHWSTVFFRIVASLLIQPRPLLWSWNICDYEVFCYTAAGGTTVGYWRQAWHRRRGHQWYLNSGYLIVHWGVTEMLSVYKWGPTYKRVVSNMELNCRNVLSIKFHNKSWASKVCQMIFRWSSKVQRTT